MSGFNGTRDTRRPDAATSQSSIPRAIVYGVSLMLGVLTLVMLFVTLLSEGGR